MTRGRSPSPDKILDQRRRKFPTKFPEGQILGSDLTRDYHRSCHEILYYFAQFNALWLKNLHSSTAVEPEIAAAQPHQIFATGYLFSGPTPTGQARRHFRIFFLVTLQRIERNSTVVLLADCCQSARQKGTMAGKMAKSEGTWQNSAEIEFILGHFAPVTRKTLLKKLPKSSTKPVKNRSPVAPTPGSKLVPNLMTAELDSVDCGKTVPADEKIRILRRMQGPKASRSSWRVKNNIFLLFLASFEQDVWK
ncbi:hypothetical protein B0H16DRAFT_1827446 [Mycena metata]|uniref:Uncharacterized protein n=1 Tax=Mycena metata TaxID=1033252 RepID=A0AAD7M821_9AGAR|nr:hypothetical protein B0H16DRAFT_1827446 [Mycena metata]